MPTEEGLEPPGARILATVSGPPTTASEALQYERAVVDALTDGVTGHERTADAAAAP
jgi:hypothetical protein